MLLIRPYLSEDKIKLLEIFKLNIPRYFDPQEIKEYTDYLDMESASYFTIESDNNIIGGTGIEVNEIKKTGSITWIFFDPRFSGKGFGKQAVNYCLNELQKDEHVEKYTVRTSQLANTFFEKFGFKTSRIENDYWGKGLDLYEMEKHKQQ